MAEAALGAPGAHGSRTGLAHLVRFLAVGASNTLITLVLFVVLQRWLSAPVAYTAVFALGLSYTTAMTANVVFGARLTWRTGGSFVGWYLLVYGIGMLAIHLLQVVATPSATATALLTVAITAPLNFLGGRLLFRTSAPTV